MPIQLTTAPTIADRRANDGELIRYYLDRLAAEGGPRVTLDFAMRAYRRALPSAFAFWTLALKPDPAFPDLQPASAAKVFIERIGQEMADHGASAICLNLTPLWAVWRTCEVLLKPFGKEPQACSRLDKS